MAEPIIDDKKEEVPSTPSPDAEGESSTPKDDKTLDQIVGDVIAKHKDVKESDSSPKEQPLEKSKKEEPAPIEEVAEEKQTDVEEEKKDNVPFNNHPRWKEVLSERDTAIARAEKAEPLAATAEALSTYCNANDITQDDLVQALELAALAKKDIPAFRQKMSQYIENIDVVTGTRLPPDLQKKVDEGVIDADSAKEVAKLRLQVQQGTVTSQNATQKAEMQLRSNIENSLTLWENTQRKSDPDYDKRRDMLQESIEVMWGRNPPRTVQDAIKTAEAANKKVKERLASFSPKPRERKPLSTTGSSTNNGEDLKLDSLDDLGALVKTIASRHR